MTMPERISIPLPPRPRAIEHDDPGPMPDPIEIGAQLTATRRAAWTDAVPARFADARLADLEPGEIADALTAWAEDPAPPNLLLFGAVGVGKTHAAIAACRRRFERSLAARPSCSFMPVSELIDGLDWRRPDSAQNLDHAVSVELLILDDFGTQRANEWVGERLYVIVNRRWLERRPTIVTTNLQARGGDDSLEAIVGSRTYSRLADNAVARSLGGDIDRRLGR